MNTKRTPHDKMIEFVDETLFALREARRANISAGQTQTISLAFTKDALLRGTGRKTLSKAAILRIWDLFAKEFDVNVKEPDDESYVFAVRLLGRPPVRCRFDSLEDVQLYVKARQ